MANGGDNGNVTSKQISMFIGSLAAIATVHAIFVVPGLLHAAEVKSRELVYEHESSVERRFVTHPELEGLQKQLQQILAQVNRIEDKLR